MKKKIIKFASDLDFINLPQPAIKYIPEWYKKTEVHINKTALKLQLQKTFKHCIPFMEAMTSGYIHEMWSDLEVERVANNPSFYWKSKGYEVIGSKTDGSSGMMDIPEGYDKKLYSFEHNLYIKTPPGYSILITQPFNRTDLPFYALSGIVDTDVYPLFPGSYPVFLKSGYTGLVNRGTPMLQIIPFKRDEWASRIDKDLLKEGGITQRIAQSFAEFWYKKNAWIRKSYE
jgi:hypothetical protein